MNYDENYIVESLSSNPVRYSSVTARVMFDNQHRKRQFVIGELIRIY